MDQWRWKRPEIPPVDWTWMRFPSTALDGKSDQIYQIRGLEDSHKGKALDMMREFFLRDEPLCEALGILQEPASIKEALQTWQFCMTQNMSLACYTEVDGKPKDLVGVDVLFVLNRNDPMFRNEIFQQFPGKIWTKILHTVLNVKSSVNVYDLYKTDKCLTSIGTVVLPEYRGRGIGRYLLDARDPLCEAVNLEVSTIICTAIAAEKMAAKCHYEMLLEFEYTQMLSQEIDLSACTTPSAKYMAIKYKFENEKKE